MVAGFFSLCIFAGSFLLFLIQPLVWKLLLPCLGGVPAVWTTCMLFFQGALLAGYVYAEKSVKWRGAERQSVVHVLLLTLSYLLLPVNVAVDGAETAAVNPTVWLFARLSLSIGFLFFLLSANSPLLQRYYSLAGQRDSSDPYFLYSASNLGSLTALLIFPFLLEPFFKVSQIRVIWSGLYLIQTALFFVCCIIFWYSEKSVVPALIGVARGDSPNLKQKVLWVFLGFLPCSAMLAVTTHVSTDIASGAFLWVLPPLLYLFSFVLAFARSEYWRNIQWAHYMLPMALVSGLMYKYFLAEPAWFAILLHFAFMFLLCMCFHSRLALLRPSPEFLTSYYVLMSIGGIAAGIFNGIIAPLCFKTQLEYILTILLAAFSLIFFSRGKGETVCAWQRESFVILFFVFITALFARFDNGIQLRICSMAGLCVILVALVVIHFFLRQKTFAAAILLAVSIVALVADIDDSRTVLVDRGFFGVIKITRLATDGKTCDADLKISGVEDVFYRLYNGTTLHGVERKVKIRPVFPLSYYSRESPIGSVFKAALIKRSIRDIAVVGLGCGTLAWYGRPWQHFDFYEIDPKVVEIAENPAYFTYLSNSKASWRNIVGDARINLQSRADARYDLIVIDAYSSGSVPVHLMTLEAFKLYRARLKKSGMIVFHISSRYFNFAPVIKRVCDEIGFRCLEAFYDPAADSIKYDWYDFDQLNKSRWIAAAADPKRLDILKKLSCWAEIPDCQKYPIWTDDYANIFHAYNWR